MKQVATKNEENVDRVVAPKQPECVFGDEIAIFDGKSLNGWEFISQPHKIRRVADKARSEEAIRIVGGVMMCQEEPKYWLYTSKTFSDFVLTLDYRFPDPPVWNTGSAILLRMTQAGPNHDAHVRVRFGGWTTGKILPPDLHLPQKPAGSGPLPALAKTERPFGEWNTYEVTCVESTISVKLNGVLINKENLVMARQGMIGLAPQGSAVEFRNIKLRPITEVRLGQQSRSADMPRPACGVR